MTAPDEIFKSEQAYLLALVMNPSSTVPCQQQIASFKGRIRHHRSAFLKSSYAAQVVIQYFNAYGHVEHTSRNIENNAMIEFLKGQIAFQTAENYFKTNQSPQVKGYNAEMKSIWEPFNPSYEIESMVSVPWCVVCKCLTQALIPQVFCDLMNMECKFEGFTKLFGAQLQKMKENNLRAGHAGQTQLNQFVITPLLTQAGLSADEAVQCSGFPHWFSTLFHPGAELPSFVNEGSCLKLWMQQPSFKAEWIDPNSLCGCHLVCALIARHIPEGRYFIWEDIARFKHLQYSRDEMGKVDAVITVMNEAAREINMDPLYLAVNAPCIVSIMKWLTDPSDPTKKTPFQRALDRYELIVEADRKDKLVAVENEARAKRLERAAIQKAQTLARAAEWEARAKEQRTCLNCCDDFQFVYPLGKEAGFPNPDLKEGEIDSWALCINCNPLLCPLCKKHICLAHTEVLDGKCQACPDVKCATCNTPVRHQTSLEHKVCYACYLKSVCHKCSQYSPTGRVRGRNYLCQQCTACSVCQGPLPSQEEQLYQMCTTCKKLSELMD